MTAFQWIVSGILLMIYMRIWRVCDHLSDIKKLLEKR